MDKRLSRVRDTWDNLGGIDPMWAILTQPSKFGGRWSEEDFYASGQREVHAVMAKVDSLAPGAATRRALDFGCGMGRLSRALCERYARVDGVDVAPSMIALAKERNAFPEKCHFHLNDASDLALFGDETFDLIYSNIVLQHMSPVLGLKYLAEFERCASPRGLIIFQLPHRRRLNYASVRRFALHAAYKVLPTPVVRWYRRRKHRELPQSVVERVPKIPMEMHSIARRKVESTLPRCTLLNIENSSSPRDAFTSYTYFFQKRS